MRRRLMEDQENREWKKKEDDIRKLHSENLELVE
jgi:hypothetical protein